MMFAPKTVMNTDSLRSCRGLRGEQCGSLGHGRMLAVYQLSRQPQPRYDYEKLVLRLS
jgi:hypothetical protein